MFTLFHYPICPFSRKVRIYLAAKNITFDLSTENFWKKDEKFSALNPAETIPVLLVKSSGQAVCGSSVIIEYIEEKFQEEKNFIGNNPEEKAESRRIQAWFDEKFYTEILKLIVNERYFKRFLPGNNAPDSEVLRQARNNLAPHFSYLEFLLDSRKYLNGDYISLADFAGAAHFSVLDYFGDINWSHHPLIKEWYGLVKSHKFFGEILKDRLPAAQPVAWYSNLDF